MNVQFGHKTFVKKSARSRKNSRTPCDTACPNPRALHLSVCSPIEFAKLDLLNFVIVSKGSSYGGSSGGGQSYGSGGSSGGSSYGGNAAGDRIEVCPSVRLVDGRVSSWQQKPVPSRFPACCSEPILLFRKSQKNREPDQFVARAKLT